MDELRRIRNERGLSQQRLAGLAGVDKVTIVHIEGGKVSPKVETLEKLATALEVEIADFFPKVQAPLPFEVHTSGAELKGEGTLDVGQGLVLIGRQGLARLLGRTERGEMSAREAMDEVEKAEIRQ
jgi:transcriptional regulator with XRE-family HTH domain